MDPKADQATLRERLAAQAGKAPPEVIDRIKAAQAEVEESGIAPGLEVGDLAPEFSLPDATGRPVSLRERLADGPVVLSFYRGEWCPYCNIELRALQEVLPDLREEGASLVAISPQKPDDALTVSEKQRLEFDVLSDSDQTVIREYRVQYRVPAPVEEISLEVLKNDVSKRNADGTWNLPVPATFVVDQNGVITARHVSANYMTSRMEPSEIVEAVREGNAADR
jgi:peroxiredoxin